MYWLSNAFCRRRGFSFVAACIVSVSIANGQFDNVINLPGDFVPESLQSNTQINVSEGGEIFSPGLTFVLGSADGSVSNIELNAFGGDLPQLALRNGSVGNFIGGAGESVTIESGAAASISGGAWDKLQIFGGSLSLSGGQIGDRHLLLSSEAGMDIDGGEFLVNSVPVEFAGGNSEVVVPFVSDSVITGRLADGQSFGLVGAGATVGSVSGSFITLRKSELPPIEPLTLNVPGDSVPLTLGRGQSMRVDGEFTFPSGFKTIAGSTLDVGRGAVGRLAAIGGDVNFRGGRRITYEAFHGTTTVISGGRFETASFWHGSETVISGGTFLPTLFGRTGLFTYPDAGLRFVGINLTIDSTPIAGLERPGDQVTIDRQILPEDATLQGVFPNGDIIDFAANLFRPEANVSVSLAFPENYCDFNADSQCNLSDINALVSKLGSDDLHFDFDYDGVVDRNDLQIWLANAGNANDGQPFTIGDVNLDGSVNSSDLGLLLNNFGQESGAGWEHGDMTGDGIVNSTDLGQLLNNFRNAPASTTAVPEPDMTALLICLGLLMLATRRSV